MPARSASLISSSSMPRPSQRRTHAPAISWASRKGTCWRTSHSATSVASEKPCPASSAIRVVSNSRVATCPVKAGSSTSRVSTESNTGSLSSCRSRLYASGSAFSVVSSPVRLPTRRPDFPRASSAMSGFFFCGMMLDPVDHASCSRANPNSLVAHRMTSSETRERSTPIIAVTNANSAAKSREAVPSMEFAQVPLNPSSDAMAWGSSPSDAPARAPPP